MNQHRFGVNAAYLGAKAARTPDERPGPAGWSGALLLDEFYRANGNPGLVTPTKAQAAWDDTFLYVLFLNWESAENADQVRRDIDELVVSSGTLGHRDFAVFSVGRNGEAHGVLESGMTYIGGDEAFGGSQPNLPFHHVGNQADIRTIDPQSYTVVVDHQAGFWSAAYKIPWTLVGGFPKGDCFAFQVYRKKQATGEILCPTPLDLYINLPYWFEYDPSTFMEAYLGGDAGPVYGTELYAVLPSARRRWTRYTEISGVQPGELKQLWTELTALPETTEENVAAHVALAQRLQDVLYQEAVDFFWDEAGSRPVGHMEPWNERHVFNELLAAGEAGKAYARLNRFLRWLARYIQWYYTDGTLGDQSADWTPYEQLRQVTTKNSKIVLDFGNAVPTLELIFAEAGFRLKSKPDGGLFSAVPDTFTVSEDGAGSIEATRNAWGRNNFITVELHGTLGSLYFNYERLNELQVCLAGDPDDRRGFKTIYTGPAHFHGEVTWNIPGMNIGYGELKSIESYEFIKAVVEGRQPSTSFAEGYRVERVCDAVKRSAETGRWVTVND